MPDPAKTAWWLPDRGYGQSRGHQREKERALSRSLAVGACGYFTVHAMHGLIPGISYRFCTLIQRADDYGYALTKIASKNGEAGMGQVEPAALIPPQPDRVLGIGQERARFPGQLDEMALGWSPRQGETIAESGRSLPRELAVTEKMVVNRVGLSLARHPGNSRVCRWRQPDIRDDLAAVRGP